MSQVINKQEIPVHLRLRRAVSVHTYLELNGLLDIWFRAAYELIKPLELVLNGLPEDDFQVIWKKVRIVVREEGTVGLNIHPPKLRPAEMFTVIFCCHGLNLSFDARVGLVAHELAHTFDEVSDEAATDAKARSWGFADQILCIYTELGCPEKATKKPEVFDEAARKRREYEAGPW